MTSDRRRTILLSLYSPALAAAAPLAVIILLRPDGPIGAVLIILAAAVGLTLVRHRLPGWARRTAGILLGLFYGLAAFVLVIYILVIPFTYYLAWLDLVRGGKPGGIISFLFYAVTAFFAGVFAGSIRKSGLLRPTLGMALVVLFEALIIRQTVALAAIFTALGVVIIVFHVINFKKPIPRRLVLPGILLTVSFGLALLLGLGSPPNSGVLVRAGLLTSVKRVIVGIFPDLSALSSVAGYGYSFDRDDLGRKPILSSVPLLRVDHLPAGTPGNAAYLRTQIFDEYFNNNWGVNRSLLDRMANSAPVLNAGGAVSRRTVSLTVLFDYVPLLPHTLDTRDILLPARSPATLEGGDYDIGFALDSPLVRGDSLTLELFPVSPPPDGRTGEREDAEAFNVRPVSANEPLDELRERYLQTPSTITPRIRALARRLSAGTGRDWETVGNIIRYLNGGFVYSLDTELPPPGDEFTDDFLFITRRGYCVHFATAFVMLARLNNIPCRYATGFLAFFRPGQRDAVITGYNAHAWPEIWLADSGWITVEATPAFNPANAQIPDFYRFFNPGHDRLTAFQLEAFMHDQIALNDVGPTGAAAFFASLTPLLPWAGGLAVAGAVLAGGVWLARRRRRAPRLYRGNLRRFNRALCRLVTRLERQGLRAPEESGWVRWGEDLKLKFPEEKPHIDALVRTAAGVFFARRPAGDRKTRFVKRVSRRLRVKALY